MKMKKWLMLTLALILCLGVMTVAAAATEQDSPAALFHAEIPFRVNPAYEDLYSPEDLAALLEDSRDSLEENSGTVSHQQPALHANESDYLSVEQAGVQLRQKMKNRENFIEVLVASPSSDYNAVVAEVVNAALVHTGVPTEGDYLMWHFGGWEGEVFREQSGGNYLYRYELVMVYYTTNAQEKTLDDAVAELLYSLNLSGKSDYEKVCAVYDYICTNITYDYLHLEIPSYTLKNSAYAALDNKTAICQGYANLLYRLLLEMGIDSRIIAGDTVGGGHAWNIVKLGDVYYNLDSTWDADANTRDYFLQNSEGFADHLRYIEYATSQFHTDYPMSATDYVDGVAGVPENVYVAGICGEDAYWTLGRDRVLTILGTGATDNYAYGIDGALRPEWEYWKDSFDTVVVEEGITALGTNLFVGYQSIIKADLPAGLQRIESQAFANCQNLSQLTLREGVEEIGSGAFRWCALEEVTLPSTIKTINGFEENRQLKTVTILAEEVVFGDGAFTRCERLEDFQLPAKTTWIGKNAFSYCYRLDNIVIPETVTEIGERAFTFCKSLQNVVINSHCEIGFGAFLDCENLKSAVINGDCDIGRSAFSNCKKLETVQINGQTKLIWDAFENCELLKEITIPESVEQLIFQCFRNCTGLEKIVFTGDEPIIDDYAFYNVTATAYYPMNNPTWDEVLQQEMKGNITWVPYCKHDYESTSTMASCIHNNETVYTCKLCGDTYTEIFRYATGQHTYTDDQDTTCEVCGGTRDLNMPTTPMYRLYNENSGEHFYTGSVEERDFLFNAGWQYEGIAWNAPTQSGAPVYRLYNPNSGDHHYTMSEEERDMLVAVGWQYEGVAWNSASPSNLPMYRLYNPNADCGSHHYTGSTEERDYLVSLGWHYEGIGWYGMLK